MTESILLHNMQKHVIARKHCPWAALSVGSTVKKNSKEKKHKKMTKIYLPPIRGAEKPRLFWGELTPAAVGNPPAGGVP